MQKRRRRCLIIYFLPVRWVFLVIALLSDQQNIYSARRNEHGQLEPDASDDVVQESLGFSAFEHAAKKEGKKAA